jgi:hypothetical protein
MEPKERGVCLLVVCVALTVGLYAEI